jgi:hypothetical protein
MIIIDFFAYIDAIDYCHYFISLIIHYYWHYIAIILSAIDIIDYYIIAIIDIAFDIITPLFSLLSLLIHCHYWSHSLYWYYWLWHFIIIDDIIDIIIIAILDYSPLTLIIDYIIDIHYYWH